jgi:hypothetical protein
MRIYLEQQVSISLPVGFQSLIACVFTDATKDERLIVDQGKVPAGRRNTTDLMAFRRGEFEAGYGSSMRLRKEEPVALLGYPGQKTVFTLGPGEPFIWVWLAVASISSLNYLQITFMSPNRHEKDAKYERMLSSVSPADAGSAGRGDADWIHRYAGPIALDVPANLQPPHVYSFRSAEGGNDLQVRFYRPGCEMESPPTLEEDIVHDSADGAVVSNPESSTLAIAPGRVSFASYILTKRTLLATNVQAVRRAEVTFPDGLILLLCGRGSQASMDQLDRVFRDLLRSVNHSKQ